MLGKAKKWNCWKQCWFDGKVLNRKVWIDSALHCPVYGSAEPQTGQGAPVFVLLWAPALSTWLSQMEIPRNLQASTANSPVQRSSTYTMFSHVVILLWLIGMFYMQRYLLENAWALHERRRVYA